MKKRSIHLVVSIAAMLVAETSFGETVFMQSFEPPLLQNWTLLDGSVGTVASTDPQLVGSNFDGLDGTYFLLFGSGDDPGNIFFEFATVPGQAYRLSYTCSASDSWSFPQRDQHVTFASAVKGFHGVVTVIDPKTGQPVDVEQLEDLGGNSQDFTLPGIDNWNLYEWREVTSDFQATSALTRVYFDTVFTTALASVGALDAVRVTTIPEPSASSLLIGAALLLVSRRHRVSGNGQHGVEAKRCGRSR